jgi:hypothetical protein
MREFRSYGSVRGALRNERPYREHISEGFLPRTHSGHKCIDRVLRIGCKALWGAWRGRPVYSRANSPRIFVNNLLNAALHLLLLATLP